MMIKFFYICIFLVGLQACTSLDERSSSKKKDKEEKIEKEKEASVFLKNVATGVYQEVELSRLAIEKASITKVREFAKNMISDYDKNLAGLLELAKRKNITIHLAGSKELNSKLATLSALKGIEFDRAYIRMMVLEHEEDVQKFKEEAQRGKDIETKAFAAGKLSILVHHLDMAKTLHDSLLSI